MHRRFVLPTTLSGWGVLLAFIGLLALGLWPVIGWINRAPSWLGMPAIVVWSYAVVFASCAVMAVANRFIDTEGPDDD
ncbi:hypothetical protein R6258_16455 [Halomonas sp. HP20-15]|uniref:hypothetical protein n=1 Tax=Halomonas sp. HP20-15 TaxID=3085901 RepID=UPI002982B04C|nr:hypothetical protein [Halomonas sp. HP20-15]MDW5378512.1 hypothetical protein [Halomonas sp. HP20-15]